MAIELQLNFDDHCCWYENEIINLEPKIRDWLNDNGITYEFNMLSPDNYPDFRVYIAVTYVYKKLIKYFITFENETDAVLFKLKWL